VLARTPAKPIRFTVLVSCQDPRRFNVEKGCRAVRPQLKATNPTYRVGDSIWIPGCGESLEIEDPVGEVDRLLDLLDGSRELAEIEGAFHAAKKSEFDVVEAIRQLDQAGLLLDAANDTTLDEYELERWKRNLGFFQTYATLERSHYEMQERLRDCKVTMLGVGGVGSHVALDLMGVGIEDLCIVDFDTVELSNLNRQILYTEADIGQRKVPLAVKRLKEYFPRARIHGVEHRLSSAADVHQVVVDRDFVICVVDRPKLYAHRWANEACVAAGVPFMSGGVHTQRATTYLVVPGQTGCVECWRRASVDGPTTALRAKMEEFHGQTTPGLGSDLSAFGPMVTVMTAMLVTEMVRYVTGIAEPLAAGRLVEMRFGDLTLREAERWERDPECQVCASVSVGATMVS
jgi:molybdopterin/thiamine biosynthesis adenylyltransferase